MKALLCFYAFFIISDQTNFAQSIEPFLATNRQDACVDFSQINDSILTGVVTNSPQNFDINFTQSIDSILNQICIIDLKNNELKYIPIVGSVDSFEYVMSGSSFVSNNEFYFVTRKFDRSNPPFNLDLNVSAANSFRTLYKVINDTIELITNLYSSQEVRDFNAFSFKNIEGDYISVLGMSTGSVSDWKIVKNDSAGTELAISDTIFAPFLKGIVQNPTDSSYNVFFNNSSIQKLDKNLVSIGSPKYIREQSSNRWIKTPYFPPSISSNPLISGILSPINVGDSVCIAIGGIVDDTVFVSYWKQLILFETISPNYNNYVFNSLFNSDSHENQFFYAYNKKQCFPGSANCTSKFRVVKHDTLNNTLWDLEFGGDAGYYISKVVALRDSGCVVFVRRTDEQGNVDLYYVYIDKNGVVEDNFLPILGGEELTIPVKFVFSIYPNPTTESITLDNLQLEKKAKRVFILNYEGKIVQQALFQKTINVSELNSGNYIYRVETVNGQYYDAKFIKK